MSKPKPKTPRRVASPPRFVRDAPVDLSPLRGLVGYQLRRAQLAVFADFIRSFADHDIRPGQFSVLVTIDENPGCRQSAIAAALGIQRSNFVALIDDLARRGLVARDPASGDRRSHALRLTGAGAALLVRLRRLSADHEGRIAKAIGPGVDRAALLSGLAGLAAWGDKDEPGG